MLNRKSEGNRKMIFRAHIIPETNEFQEVKTHLKKVAEYTSNRTALFGFPTTGYLIGLLHDLGKYTVAFDNYIYNATYNPKTVKRGTVNHSSAGAKFIFDSFHEQPDGIHKFLSELISIAIFSHHGIYDCIKLDGTNILQDVKMMPQKEIYYDEAISNFKIEIISSEELALLYNKCVNEVVTFIQGINRNDKDKDFTFALLERMLLSCLVDSDWTDTTNFMCGLPEQELEDISVQKEERKNLWEQLCVNLENHISKLSSDSPINKLRKGISDECLFSSNVSTGVYRLIVPTGGGKTLASLRFALNHAYKFEKSHIFYIIPFLSILEQNAEVIRLSIDNPNVVLEHHSNVVREEADNEDNYGHERNSLIAQTWDSPIIITTMVQFLNSLFLNKMQSLRRMHALADSIIIFDEIQALPIKMISIFNLAVNFLTEVCRSTIILCSATQPAFDQVKHPIRMSNPVSITKNIEENFRAFKRTELKDKTKPSGYSLTELATFADQIMNNSNELLLICNTKSEAAGIFNLLKKLSLERCLEKSYEVYHLSTLMCAEHRADVLRRIKSKLGNQRIICVSTQLIEAGVDISFSSVIRVVAGLDSLIQAAGRCNRNSEKQCQNVYIVNVIDERLGSLEEMKTAQQATLRLLKDFSEHPEAFDNDLLSIQAMNCYYKYYYSEINQKMDYSLPNKNTSILDLLTYNSVGCEAYDRKHRQKPLRQIFRQAFKEAGDNFEVIPNNTTDILVPYNDTARNLSLILNSEISLQEAITTAKKTQRYSVSLYDNIKSDLLSKGAIYKLLNGEIMVLSEEYYDDNVGVILEPNDMKPLII